MLGSTNMQIERREYVLFLYNNLMFIDSPFKLHSESPLKRTSVVERPFFTFKSSLSGLFWYLIQIPSMHFTPQVFWLWVTESTKSKLKTLYISSSFGTHELKVRLGARKMSRWKKPYFTTSIKTSNGLISEVFIVLKSIFEMFISYWNMLNCRTGFYSAPWIAIGNQIKSLRGLLISNLWVWVFRFWREQ